MDEKLTLEQVIGNTIEILDSIRLPKDMTAAEAAGILLPVNAAEGNLRAMIEGIRKAEEQEEEADGSCEGV